MLKWFSNGCGYSELHLYPTKRSMRKYPTFIHVLLNYIRFVPVTEHIDVWLSFCLGTLNRVFSIAGKNQENMFFVIWILNTSAIDYQIRFSTYDLSVPKSSMKARAWLDRLWWMAHRLTCYVAVEPNYVCA